MIDFLVAGVFLGGVVFFLFGILIIYKGTLLVIHSNLYKYKITLLIKKNLVSTERFKNICYIVSGSFVLLPLGVNWEVQPAELPFSKDIAGIDNVL